MFFEYGASIASKLVVVCSLIWAYEVGFACRDECVVVRRILGVLHKHEVVEGIFKIGGAIVGATYHHSHHSASTSVGSAHP